MRGFCSLCGKTSLTHSLMVNISSHLTPWQVYDFETHTHQGQVLWVELIFNLKMKVPLGPCGPRREGEVTSQVYYSFFKYLQAIIIVKLLQVTSYPVPWAQTGLALAIPQVNQWLCYHHRHHHHHHPLLLLHRHRVTIQVRLLQGNLTFHCLHWCCFSIIIHF